MVNCFPGVIFALIAALAGSNQDAATDEMKRFEGTWQLVSTVKDGNPTPDDIVKKIRVIIKAGKHSVYFGNDLAVKEIPFNVDTSKNPWTTVDTLPDGKTIKGICKLEGDTLTSCVAEVGKDFPTEFASKPGSGHTLRVFRRVAKAGGEEARLPMKRISQQLVTIHQRTLWQVHHLADDPLRGQ